MNQIGRFHNLFVTSLALLTTVISVGGCRDRIYDFGVQVVPPDGGIVEVGRPDGWSFDTSVAGAGGRGGSSGVGGRGGSAGGGVAGGTGGSVMLCNNSSPERLTDVSNCGTCFNSCLRRNADPVCQNGVCKSTCFPGFYDANNDLTAPR